MKLETVYSNNGNGILDVAVFLHLTIHETYIHNVRMKSGTRSRLELFAVDRCCFGIIWMDNMAVSFITSELVMDEIRVQDAGELGTE